jgi:alginate O-acetyltransferase complex protein AlgI
MLYIVLPIGISFYTFQAMSYTIDVYRSRISPPRDFSFFLLFICYFPQLVAGPIERADQLMPQLARKRSVNTLDVAVGLELMLIGFTKKLAIADNLSSYVELTFAYPNLVGGWDALVTAILFSIQIYCDFSGYSDIARGTSRLFGVRLMRNFEQPYFSASITEFWHRWHISLSTWLRDYLYIPLGGNRTGRLRTYQNLLVTMLLGGLWHGASINFVVWGGLHGVLLAIERMIGVRPEATGSWITLAARTTITFLIVTILWVFFRAPDLASAGTILSAIAHWKSGDPILSHLRISGISIILPITVLICIEILQRGEGSHAVLMKYPSLTRGFFYAGLIIMILLFGNLDGQQSFIYFQF